MFARSGFVGMGFFFSALVGVALAQTPDGAPRRLWPLEVRLGSVTHGAFGPERGGYDLNAEVLADPWQAASQPFYVPRLHLGTTLNFDHKTSQVYGGLTWDVPVAGPFFVEASFGGSANDGNMSIDPVPGRARLGCHVMFRESGGLGARLGTDWTLVALIEHTSNAHLCRKNTGLTDYGLKLGRVF